MSSFLDRLMGRSGDEDYVDIDLGQFEDVSARPSKTFVRFAELSSPEVVQDIRREVLDNNTVLIDISPMTRDKSVLEESIEGLKTIAEEVNGDIAGLGDDLVLIVPRDVRIDRENVLGGVD